MTWYVVVVTHPRRDSILGRISYYFLTHDGKASVLFSTLFYVADRVCSVVSMRVRRRRHDDLIFVRYDLAVAYLPKGVGDVLWKVTNFFLPRLDVSILVDVDVDTALERIESRGEDQEIFENRERLQFTRERMLELTDGWFVLDNSCAPDVLSSRPESVFEIVS